MFTFNIQGVPMFNRCRDKNALLRKRITIINNVINNSWKSYCYHIINSTKSKTMQKANPSVLRKYLIFCPNYRSFRSFKIFCKLFVSATLGYKIPNKLLTNWNISLKFFENLNQRILIKKLFWVVSCQNMS